MTENNAHETSVVESDVARYLAGQFGVSDGFDGRKYNWDHMSEGGREYRRCSAARIVKIMDGCDE